MLDARQAEQAAQTLLNDGFHCAESVLQAVLAGTETGRNPLVPRFASCFGGGVGSSREELCGALAGGLMAIGCLVGRERPGQPGQQAVDMAAELRTRFQALHGCTQCAALREVLGPQQDFHLCKQLCGTSAALACTLINEYLE